MILANNSLSQEELKKLSQTLAEARGLMDRELEIVQQVLKHEHEVGKTKIGYLNEYDAALQRIATKQSKLSESFLVYQNRLNSFEAKRRKSSGKKATKTEETASATEREGRSSNTKSIKTDNKPANKNQKSKQTTGRTTANTNGKSSSKKSQNTEDNKPKSVKNRRVASTPAVYNTDKKKPKNVSNNGLSKKEIEEARASQERAQSIVAEMRKRDILNAQEYERALAKKRTEWEAVLGKERVKRQNDLGDRADQLYTTEMKLQALRHESEEDHQDRILAVSLKNRQTILDAEYQAQESLLKARAEIDYFTDPQYAQEITALSNKKSEVENDQKDAIKKEEAFQKKKAQLELYYKRKNNGILKEEDAKEIQKALAKRFKDAKKNEEALAKHRADLATIESEKANATEREELRKGVGAVTAKGASFAERKAALYDLTHDADGNADAGKAISAAIVAVSDLATQLEKKIDEIASHKGAVDTRLQGSKNEKYAGSYWDQLVRDMTSVGAVNPYFKQEDFAKNIETLVARGIAFDLKQRAFLMTISDKIASTFEVSNATLLRLVRIQQEDSTAGRLGMESALNAFLNNMYETSEYLSDVAGSVRSSLEEMQSLMKGAEATEVEFQVQKWLGSLYSVGMSQSATQSIADALGKIAAGQIEGLTNGGAGNLLIMAANDAGLSIADILTDGINSSDTNKLLQAAVNYLAELSESAADNKVVQQQLADVFGVKASDLRAATNLVLPGTTKSIYSNSMTYNNMLSQLTNMASTMGSRTSIAEMMTNFWENGQYTLASSMASNPVSYFIYKMAKVVDDAVGGIDLPFLNVMGFGVDLNTTVSDLMRIAAVGSGILGSIGPMISGLGSSFSGRSMLEKMGISSGSGLSTVQRGDGGGHTSSQGGGTKSTSGSGYVGNASGSDIKDSTIQEAEDSKKQQMIEAKEEEGANQVDVLNQTVIKIYELLDEVASGKSSFSVKVEGYGLTRAGSTLGGVAALTAGTAGSSNSNNSGNSISGGGGINGGINGSVDFGGWTTY